MGAEERKAVVTGASTGIGQAVAVALARDGCGVVLVGRNQHGLQETLALISALPGSGEIAVADLRDAAAIDDLANHLNSAEQSVDILVNCAGVWHDGARPYYGSPLWDISPAELDEVIDVGIRAPMLLAKALLPAMIARRSGKIVNISGTFSSGGAGWLHYYVSKKALEDFTIGLADEVRPYEVQVNCVSPADVKTPALHRFFEDDYLTALDPHDVARFVSFLASADADHITGSCTILRNKGAH